MYITFIVFKIQIARLEYVYFAFQLQQFLYFDAVSKFKLLVKLQRTSRSQKRAGYLIGHLAGDW